VLPNIGSLRKEDYDLLLNIREIVVSKSTGQSNSLFGRVPFAAASCQLYSYNAANLGQHRRRNGGESTADALSGQQ